MASTQKEIPTLPENKEEEQPYTIILKTDNTQEVILKKLNTLKQLQTLVGGYIEQVDVEYKGRRVQMIVNEEGFLKNLPINKKASKIYGSPIHGNAVLLINYELE